MVGLMVRVRVLGDRSGNRSGDRSGTEAFLIAVIFLLKCT
jgi:hypothetical protein